MYYIIHNHKKKTLNYLYTQRKTVSYNYRVSAGRSLQLLSNPISLKTIKNFAHGQLNLNRDITLNNATFSF